MAPDIITGKQRPGLLQLLYNGGQNFILNSFIIEVISAFQLDADGKIVTVLPSVELRTAGVPGALVKWNVLRDLPAPVDQKVGGYRQVLDLLEIRMRGRIQRVGKQLINARRAEFPRRQADTVYDKQADLRVIRPAITIR